MSLRPRVFSRQSRVIENTQIPEGVFDRLTCGDAIRAILSDRAFDGMSDLFWRRQCERRGFDMQPKEYGWRTRFLRQCGGASYTRSVDLRLMRSIKMMLPDAVAEALRAGGFEVVETSEYPSRRNPNALDYAAYQIFSTRTKRSDEDRINQICTMLLHAGADPNSFVTSPAIISASYNSTVRLLIRFGADPTLVNTKNETALHELTRVVIPHVTDAVAAKIKRVHDEGEGREHMTTFDVVEKEVAVIERLKMLYAAAADLGKEMPDPNILENGSHRSALADNLSAQATPAIVKALFEKGAKVDQSKFHTLQEQSSIGIAVAIWTTFNHNHIVNLIKVLISRGADPELVHLAHNRGVYNMLMRLEPPEALTNADPRVLLALQSQYDIPGIPKFAFWDAAESAARES